MGKYKSGRKHNEYYTVVQGTVNGKVKYTPMYMDAKSGKIGKLFKRSFNTEKEIDELIAKVNTATDVPREYMLVYVTPEELERKSADIKKANADTAKLPLVVNFFAGPSAGKTTAALEITAGLKKEGYNVEYVSEFAKELVLEGRAEELKNQEFVTDEQYHRLDRLRNSGVEIIVTDSPVLLGQVYGADTTSEDYKNQVMEYHNSFENFNLFVERGETFQVEGPVHDLEQSKAIDKKIIGMLKQNKIFYGSYQHNTIEKTIDKINTTYSRLYDQKRVTTLDGLGKNVPSAMKALPNWCAYRTRWNAEKGKKDKFVLSPHDGHWAKSNDPTTWADFDSAMKFARAKDCEGLAFALDGKCGISCIDLDKCLDTSEGTKSQLAEEVLSEMQQNYTEISASGNGLHIFLKDTIVGNTYNNRAVVNGEEIEVYESARFISMTGNLYEGRDELRPCSAAAKAKIRGMLKERVKYEVKPHSELMAGDNVVLDRIKRSRRKDEYEALESGQGLTGNKSRDDYRMSAILAFFSGGNVDQIVRIIRSSGQNRSDKPDIYYQRTAEKAVSACRNFYGEQQASKNLQKQVKTSNRNNDEENGR